MGYMVQFEKSVSNAGARECIARNIDLTSHQNKICKQETQDLLLITLKALITSGLTKTKHVPHWKGWLCRVVCGDR